jgi:hypothetical protein
MALRVGILGRVLGHFQRVDLFLCPNLSDLVRLGWSTYMKISDVRLRRRVYPTMAPKKIRHAKEKYYSHSHLLPSRANPPLLSDGRRPAPPFPFSLVRPLPFSFSLLAGAALSKLQKTELRRLVTSPPPRGPKVSDARVRSPSPRSLV